MYYCTQDEQVSFQNALVAEAAMLANGAQNVQAVFMGDGNHGECVLPSLSDVYYWFDTLRTPCEINGLQSLKQDGVEIYPNPVNEELHVIIEQEGKHEIFLLDGFGRQIEHFTINENESRISMSGFDSGCYFIEVRSKGFSVVQRVIKQ
jgi:hypothetical protein